MVGGVGLGTAAGRGALRGVGVVGFRVAAWCCGGGACCGGGVAKQPGAVAAAGTGVAASAFHLIWQMAACMAG